MQLHKMRKTINITLLSIVCIVFFISSCGQNKYGKLKINLEIDSLNPFTEKYLNTILTRQIMSVDENIEMKDISMTLDEKRLTLEILNFSDDQKLIQQLLHSLTHKNNGLQIYETYNFPEVYPYFVKLNNFLKGNKDADSLNNLTSDTSAQIGYHIFNDLLHLNANVENGGSDMLGSGPIIGRCYEKDTTQLFAIFKTAYAKEILPKNLLIFPKSVKEKNGMLELYAIRFTPPGYKPAMEGDLILSAKKEADPSMGGFYITIQFAPAFVKQWQELTKRSASNGYRSGSCLAMVYNNKVLSAPMVATEIPNGKSQISGSFSEVKIDELCLMLKQTYMPCNLLLNNFEFTPNK